MNLTVEKKQEIDTTVIDAANEIGCIANVPTIEELRQFSLVQNELQMRVIIMRQGGVCVALSVCFISHDRVSRFYLKTYRMLGYTFFDYNSVYFKEGFFYPLLDAMREDAKEASCDLILLDNVPYKINGLNRGEYFEYQDLGVFDARKSEEGYDWILGKKSLRRDYNKLRKLVNYRCIHKYGDFSDQDIAAVASLHIERWGFEGAGSAFKESPNRVSEYCAFKNNKLLTILYNGDEIVACHYGMIYGTSILFHTPVINIKYLEYSPLKSLIYEIISFSSNNGLQIFDMGLGDESYKDGFTNDYRRIYQNYFPVSFKGNVCILFKRYLNISQIKKMVQQAKPIRQKLSQIKNRIKNRINYYELKSLSKPNIEMINELYVIDEFPKFVDLMRLSNYEIKRFHYDRYKSGDSYLCILDKEKQILSSGWISGSPPASE